MEIEGKTKTIWRARIWSKVDRSGTLEIVVIEKKTKWNLSGSTHGIVDSCRRSQATGKLRQKLVFFMVAQFKKVKLELMEDFSNVNNMTLYLTEGENCSTVLVSTGSGADHVQ